MDRKKLLLIICMLMLPGNLSVRDLYAQQDSTVTGAEENSEIKYERSSVLTDMSNMMEISDLVTVLSEGDILSYPGIRDGEVIGQAKTGQKLQRTAISKDQYWSQVIFLDEDQRKQTGYIGRSLLDDTEAGILPEGSGEGIFAEASGDGIPDELDYSNGVTVRVGTPVAASAGAALVSLGTFRITHYCPCSICCGPYANGITSTGVTATTNHTIAVDPAVIPYGSRVVINGQVYVAEDCGGAIKNNSIDIYVGSHEEGETKGLYYTDVYLLQE